MKEKLKCNHCGMTLFWFREAVNEIGWTQIDKKLYCPDCLRKLGHTAVDGD